MYGQRPDVLLALAQRWQPYRDHIEPVIQVAPEAAALHVLLKVAVGGGDQPHRHPDFTFAAEPDDRALLQRAQQFGLHRQGHFADLIEKYRTPVGLFKPARASRLGAGKSAALVAEQFRLEQRVGYRCAIDLDKRLVTPLAGQMHGAREQLLASA